MKARRLITALVAMLAIAPAIASAQTTRTGQTLPVGYSAIDTVVYMTIPQVNPALEGADILNIMPLGVKVKQSSSVRNALRSEIGRNAERRFTGFTIRVYHDNSQSARVASENVEARLRGNYPSLPVERSYSNPYFNVTVGNFRTRSDAEKALRAMESEFPDATIMKDRFKYPALDGGAVYKADTVSVMIPAGR